MGIRQTIKKQRKVARQTMERMASIPIEKNKLVKARREGFAAAAIAWAIVLSLAGGAWYGVRLAIRHLSAPSLSSLPVEK